uniref:(northern house mosquito) hypothetical protein n=1 Tax=Culex pipiens TaxID=7175 RepID=A0A8D8FD33_CULPI
MYCQAGKKDYRLRFEEFDFWKLKIEVSKLMVGSCFFLLAGCTNSCWSGNLLRNSVRVETGYRGTPVSELERVVECRGWNHGGNDRRSVSGIIRKVHPTICK